jgi:hypothetical protein
LNDRVIVSDIEKLKMKINNVNNPVELKNAFEKIFSICNKLSLINRNIILEQLFFERVGLGICYYNLNEYEKAVQQFAIAKNLNSFKTASFEKKYEVEHLLTHIKLYMAMKSNDVNLLKEVQYNMENNLNEFNKLNDARLKSRISEDKLIMNSYKAGSIKTIISFFIPYAIILDFTTEYSFIYKDVKCILEFKNIDAQLPLLGNTEGQTLEIDLDKYGLTNRTKVQITLFRYYEHYVGANEDRREMMEFSIEVFNYFIERYKIATDRYWIENLNEIQITSYAYTIKAGEVCLINSPFTSSREYTITIGSNFSTVTEKDLSLLNTLLSVSEIPLWKSLLMSAKDFKLIKKYREAVFAINCAFENLIETDIRNIITQKMGKDASDEYVNVILKLYHIPVKK